ncbi:MAG: hypothetical protein AB2L14_28575 [Candidatus Xenobiia bacterium LiM19]
MPDLISSISPALQRPGIFTMYWPTLFQRWYVPMQPVMFLNIEKEKEKVYRIARAVKQSREYIIRFSAALIIFCFLGLVALTAAHNHFDHDLSGLCDECVICMILSGSSCYSVAHVVIVTPFFTALLIVAFVIYSYKFHSIATATSRGPPENSFFSL